jgi:hypothetical protein
VDAEVGGGLRGWCGGGHGEIIRWGAEEKKKITRRRRMGRSGAMRMTPKLREIALERST